MMAFRHMYLYMFALTTFACVGQSTSDSGLKLNVLEDSHTRHLHILGYDHEYKGKQYDTNLFYYELHVERIKVGQACMFAISKKYPEDWIVATKEDNCKEEKTLRSRTLCRVERLFKSDTIALKEKLDLYLFLVDKSELDGPFIEEAEGGKVYNYYPKKGSTFLIYTYVNNKWKKIDQYKQEGDDIPRSFGADYMEKLALEKISKYVNGGN